MYAPGPPVIFEEVAGNGFNPPGKAAVRDRALSPSTASGKKHYAARARGPAQKRRAAFPRLPPKSTILQMQSWKT
jgi:hypothetical protein